MTLYPPRTMGFFSSLFGNKDKVTLEEVSHHLGGGRIQHKPNDQVWEWRGSVANVPARVETGGRCVQAWLKTVHDHGSFTLERNPAFVDDAGDSPDDAWSEDSIVRVFVGPGMYLESMAFVMGEEIAAFENLPASGAQRLVDAMPKLAVGGVNTQPGEWNLRFEPEATTVQMAEFMRVVAAILVASPTASRGDAGASGDGARQDGGEDWTGRRMKCGYCHCTFLLSAAGKCPNCGGPAGG